MKISLAKIISTIFNPVVLICLAPLYMIYVTTHDISLALSWTSYTMLFVLAIFAFIIIGVLFGLYYSIWGDEMFEYFVHSPGICT